MAVLFSFVLRPAVLCYDASRVSQAKMDIMRAIAVIQEQAQLTPLLREIAVCELSLNECAVYCVAAREYVADLPGTKRES